MRRVVVTGMGIVSCIGNNIEAVTSSLQDARSGLCAMPQYAELGFRSQVAGKPTLDTETRIDRKRLRFMGDAAAYAYVAMADAIADAGLLPHQVSNERTGLIAGSGGGSCANQIEAADILRHKGVRRIGPYMVTRTMCSTVSACLATAFSIRGLNYSISSACATSAHCIGAAAEQIRANRQDLIFAGGGEELHWGLTMLFDAMGALSSRHNASPILAARAFDTDRDGFVIAGGGGMLVLEELAHARARGATIYAEIVGYGSTSDGQDMVFPSGDGAIRCMRQALNEAESSVDYLNAHGTSTPVGDTMELYAIREVFGPAAPPFSSTKSLTGHALGAAGVHEAIYSLLMLKNGFVAGSVNVNQADPAVGELPLVRTNRPAHLKTVMSNSFGFGGTNACLIFRRLEE